MKQAKPMFHIWYLVPIIKLLPVWCWIAEKLIKFPGLFQSIPNDIRAMRFTSLPCSWSSLEVILKPSILLFGMKPWRFPRLRKFSSTFPMWEETVAVSNFLEIFQYILNFGGNRGGFPFVRFYEYFCISSVWCRLGENVQMLCFMIILYFWIFIVYM